MGDRIMTDTPGLGDEIPTHPEEMKASYELRIGKSISVKATARITPAGIVTTGLTILAVTVAFSILSTGGRRRY
jgi:hypothetical protein